MSILKPADITARRAVDALREQHKNRLPHAAEVVTKTRRAWLLEEPPHVMLRDQLNGSIDDRA